MALGDTVNSILEYTTGYGVQSIGSHIVLKNRFSIEIGLKLSISEAFSFPPTVDDLEAKVKLLKLKTFSWDRYIESVSNPVRSRNFNPIKYSDLYEYVESFENTHQIELNFVMLDHSILDAINDWMSLIHNERGFGYYNHYGKFFLRLKMLSIDTLDDLDSIEFYEIYPVAVGFTELNHSSNNIMRLSVRFVFRTMKLASELDNGLLQTLVSVADDLI